MGMNSLKEALEVVKPRDSLTDFVAARPGLSPRALP